MECLQEKYAMHSTCYGCGPSNDKGLKVRSIPQGDEVICEWKAQPYHEAFPGVLNGGVIGSILDCHSNWSAAWYIMQKNQMPTPPCTVTAEYSVKLLRPTPASEKITLKAKLVQLEGDRATISAELWAGGKLCDTCRGVFVAVKPGHPAYHRW